MLRMSNLLTGVVQSPGENRMGARVNAGMARRAKRLRTSIIAGMEQRGRLQKDVAAEIGISAVHLSQMTRGRAIPSHAVAVRLAEALHRPAIASISLAMRRRVCDLCGAPFVDSSASLTRRFCAPRCSRTVRTRVLREQTGREAVVTKHRLTMYQEAVDAMCRECEPEGICRTPECPLQKAGISPLRVMRVRIA